MTIRAALEGADDTIVAQATAPGAAAIAIVRLSGPAAVSAAEALAGGPLAAPHVLSLRRLARADGSPLDRALVVQMPGPRSYTGEDMVELHLHGGPAVVAAVLAALRAEGARQAGPGEFTRRAYLHGKVTLAEVEAIGSLVQAENEAARRAALSLLEGGLAARLRPVSEALAAAAAGLRAAMDFPADVADEGEALAAARKALPGARAALAALLAERLEVDGSEGPWVIEGPPNAGKSTLLNALAGDERALVDAAPGTTRDALSAPFRAGGRRIMVWDTAGQHAAAEGVEARGIARGQALARRASLRLWLLGPEVIWPPAEEEALAEATPGRRWLVASHADVLAPATRQAIEAEAAARNERFAGFVCVPTGEGLPALLGRLEEALVAEERGATVAMNDRHVGHVEGALSALERAEQDDMEGAPETVLLADLEAALSSLEAIDGQDLEQAVFEQIFRRFCVGK